MGMNAFTIKDLENLSGIKAHTIRIWEQRYSFLRPQRSKTNIRYYCNDELKTILNIALLNKYGFKISHIDKMSADQITEKILSLNQADAVQERLLNEMLQHMVDLDSDKFEAVLDGYIRQKGIDKTINFLIFPFLEKIGILWMTSHINPAQEHLVSHIIRQKLVVGIDSVFTHIMTKKTVLLFLPEGEHHELGLLYMHYLLKNRGIKVLYLGANVPLKDLEFVAKFKTPDYIYTHVTCLPGRLSFEKFLAQVSQRISQFPVIISGQLAQAYPKKPAENIHLRKSMQEVQDFVARL